MNYLTGEGLTKIYGDKVLFDQVDLAINKGQKMALIARNGVGKTSLLNILAGLDSSDGDGKVTLRRGIKIGFLPQEPELDENDTVLEAVFSTDNPNLNAVKNYERALQRQELSPSPENSKALQAAIDEMSLRRAWDYEAKVKEILSRFNVNDYGQKIASLSGGERKRLALAATLIQEPDLLILDEPTNHLDLEMVEWLENHFARQPNLAMLLVTHDRYFLNLVTDEIVELEHGELFRYRGNYEYYLEKKAERLFNLRQETDKAQKLLKKEMQWLRTQPKARTTKSKARTDRVDGIKEKAHFKTDDEYLGFEGIKMVRLGSKTVDLQYVSKSYGDKLLVKDFAYNFKRRDRVGIVGKNGAGKSTLVNMITGHERPTAGRVVAGTTVEFGHYTQSGLQLERDQKVIEVVRDIAEVLPMEKGRLMDAAQLLNFFHFPYSKHENYVSTLSGGEQRRLYLLTVLMRNPNFLILDEPTNDLDLVTLNVLEDFLLQFEGCLIIVSHDRYFMDKLVDHLFVFEGGGYIRDFPGNYSQYRDFKEKMEREERERKKETAKEQPAATPQQRPEKEKTKLSFGERREYEQLGEDIERLEAEKAGLSAKLNAAAAPHGQLTEWAERLGRIVEELEAKEDRWLELSEYA